MKKQLLLLLMIAGLSSATFAQKWAFNGTTGEDVNGVADGTGTDFNWEKNGNWQDRNNSNAVVEDNYPSDDEANTVEIRGGYMNDTQNVNLSTEVVINNLYIGSGSINAGSLTIKSGGKITADGGWTGVGTSAGGTLTIEQGGVFDGWQTFRISREGTAGGKLSEGIVNCAGELNVRNLEFQTKSSGSFSGVADLNILGRGIVTVGRWSASDFIAGSGFVKIADQGTLIYTSTESIKSILDAYTLSGEINVVAGGSASIVLVAETSEEVGDPAVTVWTTTLQTDAYVLSVEDQATLSFSVYPNPSSDRFSIQSKSAIANIRMYNSLGQEVLNVDGKSSIDISSLNAGFYVLKAIDADGNVGVKRVIKQ